MELTGVGRAARTRKQNGFGVDVVNGKDGIQSSHLCALGDSVPSAQRSVLSPDNDTVFDMKADTSISQERHGAYVLEAHSGEIVIATEY